MGSASETKGQRRRPKGSASEMVPFRCRDVAHVSAYVEREGEGEGEREREREGEREEGRERERHREREREWGLEGDSLSRNKIFKTLIFSLSLSIYIYRERESERERKREKEREAGGASLNRNKILKGTALEI